MRIDKAVQDYYRRLFLQKNRAKIGLFCLSQAKGFTRKNGITINKIQLYLIAEIRLKENKTPDNPNPYLLSI